MSAELESEAFGKACSWVLERLESFNPGTLPCDFSIPRAQQFSELLLSAYCVYQNAPDYIDYADRVSKWCSSVDFNQLFSSRLRDHPDELVLYCDVYSILLSFGFHDLETRTFLMNLLEAGIAGSFEKLPHRWLDLRLSLEWSRLPHQMRDFDYYVDASIAGSVSRPIQPFLLFPNCDSAYAFTHVFLFIYGFGTEVFYQPDSSTAEEWSSSLRQLMVISARDRHWDLLAESIMCHDSVSGQSNPTIDLSLGLLLNQQCPEGNFPGPESAIRGAAEVRGELPSASDQVDAEFRFTYHTTLVMIMLLAQRTKLRRMLAFN